MAKSNEAKIRFSADTSEFNDEIRAANNAMTSLRGELKLNQAQMKNTGESVDGLTRNKQLLEQQELALQQKIVALSAKLEASNRIFGEGSQESQKLANQLNAARTAQERIKGQIEQTTQAIEQQRTAQSQSETAYAQLSRKMEDQKAKLASLQREYADAVIAKRQDSAEARELRGEIAQLSRELSESESRMAQAESAARDLARGFDDVEDASQDTKNSVAELAGGTLIADFASAGIEAIAGLVSETEEYRESMNKLTTAYEWSGRSSEEAMETYRRFYEILGDSDQATEAAQDMNNLADAGADINAWYDIASGTVAAFGDALPVENLIESANETVRCGTVTGGLADALNWTSINQARLNAQMQEHPKVMEAYNAAVKEGASQEDAMNAALAACGSEQERVSLLTAALGQQYSELGTSYQESNASVIESRRAHDDLLQAQSQLAAQIMPLQALFMGFAANGVQFLSNNLSWIVPITISAGAAFGILAVAMNFGSIVQGLSAAIGVLNAVMDLNPAVRVVAGIVLLIGIFVTLWNNCEEFRNFWIGLWDSVCQKANEAGAFLDANFLQPLKMGFQSFVDFMTLLFTDPFAALRQAGQAITGWFSSNFPSVSNTVGNVISQAQSFFQDPFGYLRNRTSEIVGWVRSSFPGVSNAVGSVIGEVQSYFRDPFGYLRNKVSEIVSWVRSNFRLPQISFPHIKLPHFSIRGSFSLDPPSVPYLGIDWYAKGAILNKPAVFGMRNGRLQVGGEAGTEVISPLDKLKGYMADAVSEMRGKDTSLIVSAINKLAKHKTVIEMDGRVIAEGTASARDRVDGSRQSFADRGLAAA